MLTYITRRILLLFPTLLGMTALVFFVMGMAPGGIGGTMLDRFGNLKSEEAARVREYYEKRYGLKDPLVVQYGAVNAISPIGSEEREDGGRRFGFKWPSLGESMEQHRPVWDLMMERLPVTLLLNAISIPIVYGIGVSSGIRAARKRGGLFDRITSTTQLAMWSMPTIWVGVMMIGFLANREYVKWFPTAGMHAMEAGNMTFLPARMAAGGWDAGYLLDGLWHVVLPVICLSLGASAYLTKLTRGSMLENLSADYARTARAKGLAENVVVYRHVFRNSMLALITVAATILPAMIGGSVVVESIFSIPGMGQLGVQSVQFRDREVVLAVALVGGLIGLLSQLLRDIFYAVADPRVSYD